MTPTENADVAYAILDGVNDDLANGRPIEFVAVDVARAQVYATLATVPVPSATHEAIKKAVDGGVSREGIQLTPGALHAAANAVMGLL